jgi:hypothetical protein
MSEELKVRNKGDNRIQAGKKGKNVGQPDLVTWLETTAFCVSLQGNTNFLI